MLSRNVVFSVKLMGTNCMKGERRSTELVHQLEYMSTWSRRKVGNIVQHVTFGRHQNRSLSPFVLGLHPLPTPELRYIRDSAVDESSGPVAGCGSGEGRRMKRSHGMLQVQHAKDSVAVQVSP